MTEKILGKITHVHFGILPDYPFFMGLDLTFGFESGGIGTGGKYMVNISDECRWKDLDKNECILDMLKFVEKTLKDAKAENVFDLKNKPVEVEIENYKFKDFRILKEVL